eukprot:CAMPEP_0179308400 /NCGR_PEP_ID=MMETSP0797-20121207/51128_1 /TAXON_ID=47934 /ORGANISM="Dinophysis acuminata, Strain DAEP01" /LENGTH=73 /DNA_ID=CAMNT_0021018095 /DNA_START=19 /DNA_END=237 /DNA_ORIENTATION=+
MVEIAAMVWFTNFMSSASRNFLTLCGFEDFSDDTSLASTAGLLRPSCRGDSGAEGATGLKAWPKARQHTARRK